MPQSTPAGSEVPRVGVGCIVLRGDYLLMVRNRRGFWSTPGGHLEFGESPPDCAIRETREEAGVDVTNVEFVAITNDVLQDTGRHYVTIWMRGETDNSAPVIGDIAEIAEFGWFTPETLPKPLFLYFLNLISGQSMPAAPSNMPFAARLRAASATAS
jgi:8-oxo-dGTP diphosphatase